MDNAFGLTFHHFGLAVRQPEKAVRFLDGLGYGCSDVVEDPLQNVNLIMCHSSTMPDVEVIFPRDTPGPLDNYLSKASELIYHTCYTSPDVAQSVQSMKAAGFRIMCVSEPKPAPLFDGKSVSFYMVVGFGLIEIIQEGAA